MLAKLFATRNPSVVRKQSSFRPRLESLEERITPQGTVGLATGGGSLLSISQPTLTGAFGVNYANESTGESFVSSSLIGIYNLYTEGGLPGVPQNAYFLAAQINSGGASGGGGGGVASGGGGGGVSIGAPSPNQLALLRAAVPALYELSAQVNVQQTNNLVIDEAFLGLETFTLLQAQFQGVNASSIQGARAAHVNLINADPAYHVGAGGLLGTAVFDLVLGTELINHPNGV